MCLLLRGVQHDFPGAVGDTDCGIVQRAIWDYIFSHYYIKYFPNKLGKRYNNAVYSIIFGFPPSCVKPKRWKLQTSEIKTKITVAGRCIAMLFGIGYHEWFKCKGCMVLLIPSVKAPGSTSCHTPFPQLTMRIFLYQSFPSFHFALKCHVHTFMSRSFCNHAPTVSGLHIVAHQGSPYLLYIRRYSLLCFQSWATWGGDTDPAPVC